MNTRFAVAVHILTLLAAEQSKPLSSEWIASSVNTHPALIRRLLSQLSKAGLTRSLLGAGGGALLAAPPESITLDAVYLITTSHSEVIPLHAAPNPRCPVGKHIQAVLQQRTARAEQAMLTDLRRTTIADLAQAIEARTSA